MPIKCQLSLRTMKGGQTYLPPYKRLGLGYFVVGLAQKEPADFLTGTED